MKDLRKVAVISAVILFLPIGLFPPVSAETTVPQQAAAPTYELTFEQCLEKVTAHYPVLKRQNARVEQAIAERFQAYSGLLPRVQGLGSITRGDDPVYVFGARLHQKAFTQDNFEIQSLNDPKSFNNWNFAFQGEMPLFNAFQTISRIRSSHHWVGSARLEKQMAEMESILLATEAYLRVLVSQEMLGILNEVIRFAEEDLKQAQDLKEKGMILGADFYAAKVTLGQFLQAREEVSAQVRAAQVILNILMGEAPENVYILKGQMPSEFERTGPLSEWLSTAYLSRKDLLALREKIKAQKVEVFREKTSILPRISAVSTVQEDVGRSDNGGSYTMGFAGKMDVLDPSYPARIKKAKAFYDELTAEEDVLKDQIAKSLTEEVLRNQAYQSSLGIVRSSLLDSKEAVGLTAVLYREGRKSIADLLEMRNAYLMNALKQKELSFGCEIGRSKLRFLSGNLDQSTVAEFTEHIQG